MLRSSELLFDNKVFVLDLKVRPWYSINMMKVGGIYEIYGLAKQNSPSWCDKVCVYLGESPIYRNDGVTVVNHKFLVGDEVRLCDRTFLPHLKEIQT